MPTSYEIPKRDSILKSSVSGEALGGSVSGAAKGAAIGSVVPGVGTIAGAVVGGIAGGIKGMLSHRKKQAAAAEAAMAAQAKLDQANLELKRKAASFGSLLTFMEAHPEKYGKSFKADMFGWHPGPLTEEDYKNIGPPLGIQSGFGDELLGGIGEAAQSYLNDKAGAETDVKGQILSGFLNKTSGGGATMAARPSWTNTPIGGSLPAVDTSSIALYQAPKRRTGLFGS